MADAVPGLTMRQDWSVTLGAAPRLAPGADFGLADEWLEADGRGGYASGTVGGPRTRRYHALLLTADRPPTRRFVLVNGIEAWATRGEALVPLSTQYYAPGVLSPEGWRQARAFRLAPWPCWTFALPDGTVVSFEIFVAADGCDTVLRWQAKRGCDWTLHVRPLLSGRDQHALHTENPDFDFTPHGIGGNVVWRPYAGVPAIAALSNGAYRHAPAWYRNFLYAWEHERGLDCLEDLAAPGEFRFALGEAEAVMILRAGDGAALRPAAFAGVLAAAERARRGAAPCVVSAAGSYLVDRAGAGGDAGDEGCARGVGGRTVLAGFPWFSDWGRDSFIALRGLCLAAGDAEAAGEILLQWAGLVNEGMLPNRFPDDGGAPEYNSVDASLWFIVAVHDFLAAGKVAAAAEAKLAKACLEIVAGYRAGTRYGIRMEADGLIAAGVPGVQLTWMDAKVGDWVVTPRIGKPVEIAALWINALRIASRWSSDLAAIAEQAAASFWARFRNPGGGLYDVVDDGHEPGRVDASIRPNQIFAVGGLPFRLLSGDAAREVVDLVEAKLLTPLGLRTLDPADPAYCPRYRGDLRARDGAYHQGTVWPWLLGAFVDAWLAVRGHTEAARAEAAARFLPPLAAHLSEDGIGHVCEVADGDPPHRPGGCPFQAWSLGEAIRVARMLAPAARGAEAQ